MLQLNIAISISQGKWKVVGIVSGAVTNFPSRWGVVKSSRGTKKVWCYRHRMLLRGGEGYGQVKGLGKYKNCS